MMPDKAGYMQQFDNILNTPNRYPPNDGNNIGNFSSSAKGGKFKQSYVSSTNNRTPNYSVVGNNHPMSHMH